MTRTHKKSQQRKSLTRSSNKETRKRIKHQKGGNASGLFNEMIRDLEKELAFKKGNETIYSYSQFKANNQNVLYIVDMQYGFCDYRYSSKKGEEKELIAKEEYDNVNSKLPKGQKYSIPTWEDTNIFSGFRKFENKPLVGGTFSVAGSSETPQRIVDLIDKLLQITQDKLKIVVSRDYHPRNHCSFTMDYGKSKLSDIVNPDGFPPHCVQGTFESAIHYTLFQKLEDLVKESNSKVELYVAFKGTHPQVESFGVHKYHDEYPASLRQVSCFGKYKDCQDDHEKRCGNLMDGGSYIAKLTSENIAKYLLGTVKEEEFSELDLLSESPNNAGYYVCGLAADFCVKDTAVNLAKHLGKPVYIYDPSTVYATLPFSVLQNIPMYAAKLYLTFATDRHKITGTDFYVIKKINNELVKLSKDEFLGMKKSFYDYRYQHHSQDMNTLIRGWLSESQNKQYLDYYLYLSNAFDIWYDYHKHKVEIIS